MRPNWLRGWPATRTSSYSLSASITRMATLAPGGRIAVDVVDAELVRLRRAWREAVPGSTVAETDDDALLIRVLGAERLAATDLFDQAQLAAVIRVCRRARTQSEAGRTLFAASLKQRTSTNDADRLRKYLARFDLTFAELTSRVT